jgi:hypothetical protein
MDQELLTILEHLRLSRFISSSIFSFMCMFCRSLFVLYSFGHCVVCPSSIYGSDYPFGIFKLFLLNVVLCRQLFIFCPFSFGHCVVSRFSIYDFWLPLLRSSSVSDVFGFYPYLQMYAFYRVYRLCCSHILVLYWFVVLTLISTGAIVVVIVW